MGDSRAAALLIVSRGRHERQGGLHRCPRDALPGIPYGDWEKHCAEHKRTFYADDLPSRIQSTTSPQARRRTAASTTLADLRHL
jgi:hypothetical protein